MSDLSDEILCEIMQYTGSAIFRCMLVCWRWRCIAAYVLQRTGLHCGTCGRTFPRGGWMVCGHTITVGKSHFQVCRYNLMYEIIVNDANERLRLFVQIGRYSLRTRAVDNAALRRVVEQLRWLIWQIWGVNAPLTGVPLDLAAWRSLSGGTRECEISSAFGIPAPHVIE